MRVYGVVLDGCVGGCIVVVVLILTVHVTVLLSVR